MTPEQLKALIDWIEAKFEHAKFDDLHSLMRVYETHETLLSSVEKSVKPSFDSTETN